MLNLLSGHLISLNLLWLAKYGCFETRWVSSVPPPKRTAYALTLMYLPSAKYQAVGSEA
jgi:hypothetical protein